MLPLEPLPERYTIQWRDWFEKAVIRRQIPFRFVDGTGVSDRVEGGTVLDPCNTNIWKFTQLQEVCRLFKMNSVSSGDVFFVFDVWFPGLEAIPYMAQLQGVDVKVFGFLHAGSYTNEDFTAPMASWAQHFERGWIQLCRKVFVGTDYHRHQFRLFRGVVGDLVVTGNPFDSTEIISQCQIVPVEDREKIIVFPHRWDREKRPDRFVRLMKGLWRLRQDFRVVITTSRSSFRSNDPRLIEMLDDFPFVAKAGLSKQAYYQEMARARVFVSTTIEENFGYCFVEAMALGCTPVVVKSYSHPEILNQDERFLYSTDDEAVALLSKYLDNPVSVPVYVKRYDQSIDRVLTEMGF
jgi:glycosyltransferase involved in cell wall biosynthesis